MIPQYLKVIWSAIAPAVGNHLWQSTLFVGIAGLLTLALRRNCARARYWLWLAASVKFLVPFSLLVGIGDFLSWSRSSAGTKEALYFAMEEVSQPFTQTTLPAISRAPFSVDFSGLIHLLPAILVSVWFCGVVMVLFVWWARWRRISEATRAAVPLREGREVEALRRAERFAGMRQGIEVRLSQASLEPGIFGIIRPVLVWPHGISERLGDEHLESILAHEMWHVRRHDNLAAAMHMVVEAFFWFHPIVWWLGARMVEERERACDEAVLECGSKRQIYAESILKVCEFCVGSPLNCVSGVTGSDLKKRIAQIMSERAARQLDFSRRVLLSAFALAAVLVPIGFGLVNVEQIRADVTAQNLPVETPTYASVSIKPTIAKPDESGSRMVRLQFTPEGLTAINIGLKPLIRSAYGVGDDQISDPAGWLPSETYDIDAKIDVATVNDLKKLSLDQRYAERMLMLRAMLSDRFQLVLHRETKELPVYSLVTAANGAKLHEAASGDAYLNGIKRPDGLPAGPGFLTLDDQGQLIGQAVPIAVLAEDLSRWLGKSVVDKTVLTGKYDFTLRSSGIGASPGIGAKSSSESSQASIISAVEEQLGLKLTLQNAPLQIVVIDHATKPTQN